MDLAGLVWVIGAAVAVLLPALLHGTYFGPYDWLAHYGLPPQTHVTVHDFFASDQITQMIPWTNLAWTQVHHGQLPLWNPYNLLGTPLAFNWQSGAFSLPAGVGYLLPLRYNYTAQVFITIIVAGTGAYVLCRVIRLSVVACVFGAVVVELGGSFMRWLGWPVASVMSWTGWALAATILVVRGDRRVRSITLLGVALALAVYAGQPDMLIVFGMALAAFALVLLACRLAASRNLRAIVRPGVDLALSAGAALALSAPLLLPGLGVLAASVRSTGGGALGTQRAISTSLLQPLVLPGLDGWPLIWWRNYLGVLAVVLAATAMAVIIVDVVHKRGRAPVVALGVVALLAAAVTFVQPVESALNHLPLLEAVRFPRTINIVEFVVAILAGVGLDLLLRSYQRRSVLVTALAGSLAAGVALTVIWLTDGVANSPMTSGALWALAATVVALGGVGVLAFVARNQRRAEPVDAHRDVAMAGVSAEAPAPGEGVSPGRARPGALSARTAARVVAGVGMVLLAFETIFLVSVGGPLWSSTAVRPSPTSAEADLQRAVGTSLVALGKPLCAPPLLGIPANTNSLFGVHQLVDYDPMLPNRYYQSWYALTGTSGGYPELSYFCPGIETSAQGRLYGASFVLELPGSPGPTGSVYDRRIGGENLYRIPRASMATLVPVLGSTEFPPDNTVGRPVAVAKPTNNTLRMTTVAARPQVLRLRLTNAKGWHATIDGHPLPLETFAGVMLQARVPAGRHVIALRYWPTTFTIGLVLAALAAVALLVAGVVARMRRSASTPPPS